MIIRLTQKLAKKIHSTDALNTLELDNNPYIYWSANLFCVGRTQYILVTNTASLFSFIIYGRGITDNDCFIKTFLFSLEEFLKSTGNKEIFEKYIEPHTLRIMFAKSLNKAVTGSMNDFIYAAKCDMDVFNLSPHEISLRLIETPKTLLKYNFPKEVFQTMKTAKYD